MFNNLRSIYNYLVAFCLGSEKDAQVEAKVRTILSLWLVTTTVMWFYSFYCYGAYGINPVTLGGLFFTILHTTTPVVLRYSKNVALSAVMVSFTGLGFQVLFCVYSGGVFSPAAIWLTLHPVILAYFGTTRLIILSVVMNFFIVIGMYLAGVHGHLPQDTLPLVYRDGMILTSFIGLDIIVACLTVFAVAISREYNKRLKKNNELIENLVRVVSHDIGNSLTVLKLASSKLGTDDIDFNNKNIERVKKACEQIESITDSVNQWMASHDEVIPLTIIPVNSDEVIEHIHFTFEDKLKEKDLKLIINRPTNKEIVFLGDKNAVLFQIVSNIISNAIKFSYPSNKIQIDFKEEEEFVNIQVRDYGRGIDPNIIANAFDPNSKTSRKGTNNEKGTGFGLPIAHSLIKQMSGEILIENMMNTNSSKGTRISFSLPKYSIQESKAA